MSVLTENMSGLNLASIGFIITAKISGMLGVSIGFVDPSLRNVGGCLLSVAVISITCAVICSLIQTSKDKRRFDNEDFELNEIRKLTNTKRELQEKIKALELQRQAIDNLMIRKG